MDKLIEEEVWMVDFEPVELHTTDVVLYDHEIYNTQNKSMNNNQISKIEVFVRV